MNFFKRLRLYLFGVGLGIIIVYFFFKDRDLDAWMPEERVLGALKEMKIDVEENAACQVACLELPDNWLDIYLAGADVIFSKSEPRKEPCPVYLLKSKISEQDISITMEVCWDEKARLLTVESTGRQCDCK